MVLSGVVDGMARRRARRSSCDLVGTALAPGGALVVHSRHPGVVGRRRTRRSRPTWRPGRPLRAETWCHAARGRAGTDATVADGPGGADYLVTAVRATVPPPRADPAR